jgi:hypothetical protein
MVRRPVRSFRAFGIFDAFPDDSGRQSHLCVGVGKAQMQRAEELFNEPPAISNST